MCGWLLWAQKNERLHAYLLYTDPVTQNWVAISETDYKNPIKTMPWEQIAMEYTIASYVPRHFYISNISTSNAKNWCQCQWDSCQNSKISDCTLCCISHPNVFQEFRKNELKIYEKMASSGETQKIVDGTLRATMLKKPSTDSSSGTMWRATVEIESRGKRTPVVMYIRIDQDLNSIPFPGFYVSEFNYYPLVTTK